MSTEGEPQVVRAPGYEPEPEPEQQPEQQPEEQPEPVNPEPVSTPEPKGRSRR